MRCHVPWLLDRIVNRAPELAAVNAPSGSFPGRRSDLAIAECEYAATSFA
jgi:hypothetical protein